MYSLERLNAGARWELSELTGNIIEQDFFSSQICIDWLEYGAWVPHTTVSPLSRYIIS